jgi:hypothetical protein
MSAPMVARWIGVWAIGAVLLNAQPPMTMTFPGSKQPITVVIDSPEIRRLIGDQEKAQAEIDRFWRGRPREENLQHIRHLMEHPEDIPPSRKELLDATANAPTLTVQRKTHAKVLEMSKARCLPDGLSTTTFVRVLLDGKNPPGGTEVWVCINATEFDNVP